MSKVDDILRAVYQKDMATLQGLTPEDVNQRDQDGRTPLVHAVLADDADPRIVSLLIERGADVNTADNQKWTALHFAARDHKTPIVRRLLDAGAEVDAADSYGDTPLWRAVTKTVDVDLINALLERGGDPSRKNNHGAAPVDVARTVGRDDLVALFQGRSSRGH